MSITEEEAPPVLEYEPDDDDGGGAPFRRQRHRPGRLVRAAGRFDQLRQWDRRIWLTLGAITLAFLTLVAVRWFVLSIVEGIGTNIANRPAPGANAPDPKGDATELGLLLQALDSPFKMLGASCIPTNAAMGLIHEGVDKDGRGTGHLDPVRSWKVALAIVALGPGTDLRKVAIGTNNQLDVLVSREVGPSTPVLLCEPPLPPATTTTTAAGATPTSKVGS